MLHEIMKTYKDCHQAKRWYKQWTILSYECHWKSVDNQLSHA